MNTKNLIIISELNNNASYSYIATWFQLIGFSVRWQYLPIYLSIFYWVWSKIFVNYRESFKWKGFKFYSYEIHIGQKKHTHCPTETYVVTYSRLDSTNSILEFNYEFAISLEQWGHCGMHNAQFSPHPPTSYIYIFSVQVSLVWILA